MYAGCLLLYRDCTHRDHVSSRGLRAAEGARVKRTHRNRNVRALIGNLSPLLSLSSSGTRLGSARQASQRWCAATAAVAVRACGSEAHSAAKKRIARHDAVSHASEGLGVITHGVLRVSWGAAGGRSAP